MGLTGNKGEWSEIYAFLKLLSEGKLFSADEQLNRINNIFFPIMKILREETEGELYEYRTNQNELSIDIYFNDKHLISLPTGMFSEEADALLESINSSSAGSGAFEIKRTSSFITSIYVNKLKAPPTDKADINIQIHDINTGYENIVGFSIKSELGMPSTLLNAGQTTNFIFKVEELDEIHVDTINSIQTRSKIKDRIKMIREKGGNLSFSFMENTIFSDNLIMIDSQMPLIVAEIIKGYYSDVFTTCKDLINYVSEVDPISRGTSFYKHKMKQMLCAIALGMRPATEWDGTDEATGGYIIVKTSGDVLAYHIYNRDAFKDYLLNNTKLESASSSRHGYGTLYKNNGEIFIKLNLQIRFI